jgi:hypothetical protein
MFALASDYNNYGVYLVQYYLGSFTGQVSAAAEISFSTAVYYIAQNTPLTRMAVAGNGKI